MASQQEGLYLELLFSFDTWIGWAATYNLEMPARLEHLGKLISILQSGKDSQHAAYWKGWPIFY
jgi:hypothetical protein